MSDKAKTEVKETTKAETPKAAKEAPAKVTLADHAGTAVAYHVEQAHQAGDGTLSAETDKKGLRYLVGDLILTEGNHIIEALTTVEQEAIKLIALKLKGSPAA